MTSKKYWFMFHYSQVAPYYYSDVHIHRARVTCGKGNTEGMVEIEQTLALKYCQGTQLFRQTFKW